MPPVSVTPQYFSERDEVGAQCEVHDAGEYTSGSSSAPGAGREVPVENVVGGTSANAETASSTATTSCENPATAPWASGRRLAAIQYAARRS